jgi:methionine biosynthesis protein MetW
MNGYRHDYDLIVSHIENGARVMDLGCGEGDLLHRLKEEKQCTVRGVDISESNIIACVGKGLSVFQGNIDEGLADYKDSSFDAVFLNMTLQVVYHPDLVIQEMLRIGKRAVISFPNFGYWRIRLSLLIGGRAPKAESLPFEWYNTPNIRVISISDFLGYLRMRGYRINWGGGILGSLEGGRLCHRLMNVRARYGLFEITR